MSWPFSSARLNIKDPDDCLHSVDSIVYDHTDQENIDSIHIPKTKGGKFCLFILYDILFSIKGVAISCLPYSMSMYLPLHTKVVNIACTKLACTKLFLYWPSFSISSISSIAYKESKYCLYKTKLYSFTRCDFVNHMKNPNLPL